MFRLAKWFSSTTKVSIDAIKKLRQETSSPLGECKKALQESGGDHDKAMQWLKDKGMITADKKAEKSTREGVIAARTLPDRKSVILAEVNCETDFVAKNELFLQFVDKLLNRGLETKENIENCDDKNQESSQKSIESFLKSEKPLGIFNDEMLKSLEDEKKLLVSRLQENIRVRRILKLQSPQGMFGVYVHRAYSPEVGLQASLIQLFFDNPNADKERCAEFCDNLAIQYLGSPPKYLNEKDIPPEVLTQQMEKIKVSMAKALERAPANAHERMIKGKLNASLYSPFVFRHMGYVLASDGNSTVDDYWKQTEAQLQTKITLGRAQNWKCK